MRALALLLGLVVLAAPVPVASGAPHRDQPRTTAPVRLAKATGRISRLTHARITVAGLSCTRKRTSPRLHGLAVGDRAAISCRAGALIRIADLRPAPVVTGTATTVDTAPAVAVTPSPPGCPDTSFQVPSVLTLSAPGLTTAIDPPRLYPVGGNTVAEINTQIGKCKPPSAGRYAAITRYSLNYSYTASKQADGLCRLARVSVGIHVAVALPGWTPGPGAAPGLADAWQAYVAALTLHEQGHVDRDVQSAQQLRSDLEALGESDCATLNVQVSALATKSGVALAQANLDYDNETGHGATQGAVLAMP